MGYDSNGFHKDTKLHRRTKNIYNVDGYDSNKIDKFGFTKNKIHCLTGTNYSPSGYNIKGFNKKRNHQITKTIHHPCYYKDIWSDTNIKEIIKNNIPEKEYN